MGSVIIPSRNQQKSENPLLTIKEVVRYNRSRRRREKKREMRKEERENRESIGRRYGKWTVIGVERGKKGLEWICRCECGEIKKQKIWNIREGRSEMCKACSGKLRRKEKKREVK